MKNLIPKDGALFRPSQNMNVTTFEEVHDLSDFFKFGFVSFRGDLWNGGESLFRELSGGLVRSG